MPAYTVKQVPEPREFKTDHGEFRSYVLTVTGPDGDIKAERVTKKDSPAPAVGQVIEATLEPPKRDGFPPKLKPIPRGGGFAGGRSADPKVQAQIIRQHSQGMALQYAAIRASQGKLPDTFSLGDLFKIADQFDADAKAAGA